MGDTFLAILIAAIVVAVGAAYVSARRGGGSGGHRTIAGPARGRTKARSRSNATISGGAALVDAIGDVPEGFRAVFGVSTREGEVPAVVLGPTGLWALGATTARGTVAVIDGAVVLDGKESDLASVLWRRGHALTEAMSGWLSGEVPAVQAALVFTDPRANVVKREAMGVALVPLGELRSSLFESRVRLDPATLDDIHEALGRVGGSAIC